MCILSVCTIYELQQQQKHTQANYTEKRKHKILSSLQHQRAYREYPIPLLYERNTIIRYYYSCLRLRFWTHIRFVLWRSKSVLNTNTHRVYQRQKNSIINPSLLFIGLSSSQCAHTHTAQ